MFVEGNASRGWDHAYDMVIVGSGSAGLAAAIMAITQGLRPLVIEKAGVWGGSTALSGGGHWIPASPVALADGAQDSLEEALEYLDAVVPDEGIVTSRARKLAFLQSAPELLAFLMQQGMHWNSDAPHPDYYPDKPGGKLGRMIEPGVFDGRRLGPWLDTLRRSPPGYVVRSSEISRVARGFRQPGNMLAMAKVWARTRLQPLLGRVPLAMGQGLVAHLMVILQRLGGEVWLNAPLRKVLSEAGHVRGVAVERNGKQQTIRAAKGVLLCAGGFARNAEFRAKHQGVSGEWSSASADDTGDVVQMADELGAATALMDDAWWGTSYIFPGFGPVFFIWERSQPGSILVDPEGRRFANESQSYTDLGHEMLKRKAAPAWMIMDARHRERYTFASMLPGRTPQALFDTGFFIRADSIEDLARRCSVDPATLQATIDRFNAFAHSGVDSDFGRGRTAYDNFWGDPRHKPNPNLGPIDRPPFLATKVYPGDLGTKGGFITDEFARVLKPSGEVIPGLYSAGNCTASVFGRCYPGPGATLGPSTTFAFIAARHMARPKSG
jgi:3-oxosteroid 1-dehydrogenase